MNLSGEAIRAVVDYYKVDAESELIVIYDDISLDVGQLRIRKKGSAGGHNGIKNIIANLVKPILCLVFSYSLVGFPSPAMITIFLSPVLFSDAFTASVPIPISLLLSISFSISFSISRSVSLFVAVSIPFCSANGKFKLRYMCI